MNMVSKQEAVEMFNKSAGARQAFDLDEDNSRSEERFDDFDWVQTSNIPTTPTSRSKLLVRGSQSDRAAGASASPTLLRRHSTKSGKGSFRLKASDLKQYLDKGETDPKKIQEAVRRWKADNPQAAGSQKPSRSAVEGSQRSSIRSVGDRSVSRSVSDSSQRSCRSLEESPGRRPAGAGGQSGRRQHRSKSRNRLKISALKSGDPGGITKRRGRSKSRSKSVSDNSSAGSNEKPPQPRLQRRGRSMQRRGRSITKKASASSSDDEAHSTSPGQRPEARAFAMNRRRSRSRRGSGHFSDDDEHVKEVMERRRERSRARSSSLARHLQINGNSQDSNSDQKDFSTDEEGPARPRRHMRRASSDPDEVEHLKGGTGRTSSNSRARMAGRRTSRSGASQSSGSSWLDDMVSKPASQEAWSDSERSFGPEELVWSAV